MKSFLIFILLSIILIKCVKCQSDKTCYQNTNNPFSYYASKSVYSLVSGEQNFTQPNCKPLQLWLLSRHGTRHPAGFVIEKMYNLLEYRHKFTNKSSLCKEDIIAIQNWTISLTKKDGYILNSQGIDDLSSLGSRLRNAFGDIFNEPYNSVSFKVLSSPKSRSVDSAYYFLKSIFGINVTDIPLIDNEDMKLNISKFKKINDDDDMKESKNRETTQFRHSIHMQQLVFRVSKAMGLDSNLTLDIVEIMYESCRYEKAWHKNTKPAWCAVFSQEDLEILEYAEDLKYYYSSGYGDPYNKRIGCPIVKDLMTNFRNKSQTELGPKGVFYFGHSSNVLSTLVRLGFAKDSSTLLGTNYDDMRDRKWKTSFLIPFASNFMAVLYDCQGVKKVTFFANEIPITIEKHNCTLCSWDLIDKMYDSIVSSQSCLLHSIPSSASFVSKTMAWIFLTYSIVILRFLY